jgi:TP901 family phage tail tape measure protein
MVEQSARDAARANQQLDRSLDGVDDAARGAGQSTRRAARSTQELDTAATRAERSQRSFGSRLASNAAKLGRVALAAAAAGTAIAGIASVRTFADFDRQLSILGNVAGATEDQLAALSERSQELGRTTNRSASEAAGAFIALARAGQTVDEQLNSVRATLDLANVGELELAESAEIVSRTLNTFGLSADQASSAADTLTTVSNSAATTVRNLGVAIQYGGGVAAQVGGTFGEFAAQVGVLADRGIEASSAGTALRAIYGRLLNPTRRVSDAFRELGVSLEDVDLQGETLTEVFELLGERGINASQAFKIFGTEAASAGLALVDSTARVRELEEAIGNSDGAAKDFSDTLSQDTKGAFEEVASSAEGLAITFASVFADDIDALLRNTAEELRSISRAIDDIFGSRPAGRGLSLRGQSTFGEPQYSSPIGPLPPPEPGSVSTPRRFELLPGGLQGVTEADRAALARQRATEDSATTILAITDLLKSGWDRISPSVAEATDTVLDFGQAAIDSIGALPDKIDETIAKNRELEESQRRVLEQLRELDRDISFERQQDALEAQIDAIERQISELERLSDAVTEPLRSGINQLVDDLVRFEFSLESVGRVAQDTFARIATGVIDQTLVQPATDRLGGVIGGALGIPGLEEQAAGIQQQIARADIQAQVVNIIGQGGTAPPGASGLPNLSSIISGFGGGAATGAGGAGGAGAAASVAGPALAASGIAGPWGFLLPFLLGGGGGGIPGLPGFHQGGTISEPAIAFSRSGAFTLAERGPEDIVPRHRGTSSRGSVNVVYARDADSFRENERTRVRKADREQRRARSGRRGGGRG